MSRIVRATLWRSPVQLEGLPFPTAPRNGGLAGWSPTCAGAPRIPAAAGSGGCLAIRPGLRPVGGAGWALWAVGRWLNLPRSIWGQPLGKDPRQGSLPNRPSTRGGFGSRPAAALGGRRRCVVPVPLWGTWIRGKQKPAREPTAGPGPPPAFPGRSS
ncbi:hypothetical protein VUR80DRAFT_9718 [Thermomyces stellatus]